MIICSCIILRIHGCIHLQVDSSKVAQQVDVQKKERKMTSFEPEDFDVIEKEEVDEQSKPSTAILDEKEVISDILCNIVVCLGTLNISYVSKSSISFVLFFFRKKTNCRDLHP